MVSRVACQAYVFTTGTVTIRTGVSSSTPNLIFTMGRKLPTEVDILNLTYRINWITTPNEGGADQLGWCDFQSQVIAVIKDLPRQSRAETLLHEIIHAVNHGMGAPSKILEESFTGKMSIGIATTMRQSPLVWRWLIGEISAKGHKSSSAG